MKMSRDLEIKESIIVLKRQIERGQVCLSLEENEAVNLLQAVFPQYSSWSLSAMVVLHSRHFQASGDNLVQVCLEYLLGEENTDLADFLCLTSGDDELDTTYGESLHIHKKDNNWSRSGEGSSVGISPISEMVGFPESCGLIQSEPLSVSLSTADSDSVSGPSILLQSSSVSMGTEMVSNSKEEDQFLVRDLPFSSGTARSTSIKITPVLPAVESPKSSQRLAKQGLLVMEAKVKTSEGNVASMFAAEKIPVVGSQTKTFKQPVLASLLTASQDINASNDQIWRGAVSDGPSVHSPDEELSHKLSSKSTDSLKTKTSVFDILPLTSSGITTPKSTCISHFGTGSTSCSVSSLKSDCSLSTVLSATAKDPDPHGSDNLSRLGPNSRIMKSSEVCHITRSVDELDSRQNSEVNEGVCGSETNNANLVPDLDECSGDSLPEFEFIRQFKLQAEMKIPDTAKTHELDCPGEFSPKGNHLKSRKSSAKKDLDLSLSRAEFTCAGGSGHMPSVGLTSACGSNSSLSADVLSPELKKKHFVCHEGRQFSKKQFAQAKTNAEEYKSHHRRLHSSADIDSERLPSISPPRRKMAKFSNIEKSSHSEKTAGSFANLGSQPNLSSYNGIKYLGKNSVFRNMLPSCSTSSFVKKANHPSKSLNDWSDATAATHLAAQKDSASTETVSKQSATPSPTETVSKQSVTSSPTETASKQSATSSPTETVSKQSATPSPTETVSKQSVTSSPTETASKQSATSSPTETVSKQSVTSSPTKTASKQSATSSPAETVSKQSATSSPTETVSKQSVTSSPTETVSKQSATITSEVMPDTRTEPQKWLDKFCAQTSRNSDRLNYFYLYNAKLPSKISSLSSLSSMTPVQTVNTSQTSRPLAVNRDSLTLTYVTPTQTVSSSQTSRPLAVNRDSLTLTCNPLTQIPASDPSLHLPAVRGNVGQSSQAFSPKISPATKPSRPTGPSVVTLTRAQSARDRESTAHPANRPSSAHSVNTAHPANRPSSAHSVNSSLPVSQLNSLSCLTLPQQTAMNISSGADIQKYTPRVVPQSSVPLIASHTGINSLLTATYSSSAAVSITSANSLTPSANSVLPSAFSLLSKTPASHSQPLNLIDVDTPPSTLNDSQESVVIVGDTPANRGDVPDPPTMLVDPHLSHSADQPGSAAVNPAEHPLKHPGFEFGVQTVLEVFPDVDQQQIRQLLEWFLASGTLDQALNQTMNHLLENPTSVYRRKPQTSDGTVIHIEKSNAVTESRDYYKDYSVKSLITRALAADRLSVEFRNVRMETISAVLSRYNGHYAPAYRCIARALDYSVASFEEERKNGGSLDSRRPSWITVKIFEGEPQEQNIKFSLMKSLRPFNESKLHTNDPHLMEQVQFVDRRTKFDKEELDRKMAWTILETEYEEQGQSIECGCCYTEQPFENLVQCFDGHLFCCQCLLSYTQEAIFGSGKLNLACMTDTCDCTFPKSQLVKALPDNIFARYEERLAEENLNKAAMPDLVRCPSCNIAVVLDSQVQRLKCPNQACRKQTCRHCKEDWTEHIGKTCDQVEKKDETKLRTEYEEKMTTARVRICPDCRAEFFKEEGCNKMTCRCGTTMCYICRKPQISYKHFCQHPRDPGKSCPTCTKCSLWTNPDEDEKRAIAEIQRTAQQKRREQGFEGDKIIGVPDEPLTKKNKKM